MPFCILSYFVSVLGQHLIPDVKSGSWSNNHWFRPTLGLTQNNNILTQIYFLSLQPSSGSIPSLEAWKKENKGDKLNCKQCCTLIYN